MTETYKQNFTFIDLFAGTGAFRLALTEFGGQCVFSSDIDKDAQEIYRTNFGDLPAGDITKIHAADIPPHNVLCGGPPCQSFSKSGKRKGFDDARGTLFFDVARIAKHHQPEVVFLENVRNLITHDSGRTLAVIVDSLQDIGYTVFYQLLNASHYGVAQSRERVYFVCFRNDLGITDFAFPAPTNVDITLDDVLDHKVSDRYEIKRDDIRIGLTPPPDERYLRPIQIGTLARNRQGERIYSTQGHAVTFSSQGGGAGGKTGCYLVGGKVRRLTPRECARVMGFPAGYQLPKFDTTAYKLIGNSVAVPVLKAIFERVLEVIHGQVEELEAAA